MKFEWLVDKISNSDIYVNAWTFFDVLIWSILQESYHIFYFHVLFFYSDFTTDQAFQVLHSDELCVELDEVGSGTSSDVEEDTHVLIPYNLYMSS